MHYKLPTDVCAQMWLRSLGGIVKRQFETVDATFCSIGKRHLEMHPDFGSCVLILISSDIHVLRAYNA